MLAAMPAYYPRRVHPYFLAIYLDPLLSFLSIDELEAGLDFDFKALGLDFAGPHESVFQ